VHYIPDAVAYTHSPATYGAFIKQQIRWKRGFYQEAIVALTFMWRVKPMLFVDILMWDIVMPLLSIGFVLLVALYGILDPAFFVVGVVPSLLLLLFVRHLPLIFYNPRRIFGLLHYVFFNQFVMVWVGLYAMFTLKKRSWSTR
jgi:hyaluronan synthase